MDNHTVFLEIENEESLKRSFECLEKANNNEQKSGAANKITLIVFFLCLLFLQMSSFYGNFIEILTVVLFTMIPLFLTKRYKDSIKKKESIHQMSKMFMDICFDDVESSSKSLLTPENFSQYDLVRYNWLDGSDMFKFKYKEKEFIVQDITIYEYNKHKNKDVEIFKGQYVSGKHDFKLNDEIIIRSKNFNNWTAFEDSQIYMFNDPSLDCKYESISENNNEQDIIELNKNIQHLKSSLLEIFKNKSPYFALKLYPNGYYVQILATGKDLFEAKNFKTYEEFKDSTLKDIATIIPQLNIVNNIEKIGE